MVGGGRRKRVEGVGSNRQLGHGALEATGRILDFTLK